MADKLVAVRIKQQDNTYSNEIPIGAKAENVAYDNTKNLLQVLGTIDMYKGNVQTQLDALFENFNGIAEDVAGAIDDWVTEHMPSWDPEEHLDDTLTADNLAPVSSAVPKLIAVNEAEIQGTKMKISTTGQEDLTVLTPNDIDNTLSQQGEAADAKATGEMIMINNAATAGTKIRLITTNNDIAFLTEDDIDTTLSIEGAAADAKAVKNAIREIEGDFSDLENATKSLYNGFRVKPDFQPGSIGTDGSLVRDTKTIRTIIDNSSIGITSFKIGCSSGYTYAIRYFDENNVVISFVTFTEEEKIYQVPNGTVKIGFCLRYTSDITPSVSSNIKIYMVISEMYEEFNNIIYSNQFNFKFEKGKINSNGALERDETCIRTFIDNSIYKLRSIKIGCASGYTYAIRYFDENNAIISFVAYNNIEKIYQIPNGTVKIGIVLKSTEYIDPSYSVNLFLYTKVSEALNFIYEQLETSKYSSQLDFVFKQGSISGVDGSLVDNDTKTIRTIIDNSSVGITSFKIGCSSGYTYAIRYFDSNDSLISFVAFTGEEKIYQVPNGTVKIGFCLRYTSDITPSASSNMYVRVASEIAIKYLDNRIDSIENELNIIGHVQVNNALSKILADVIEYNRNKKYANIAFFTDTHSNVNDASASINIMNAIMATKMMNAHIHGGDLITTYDLDYNEYVEAMCQNMVYYKNHGEMLFVKGNHDNNHATVLGDNATKYQYHMMMQNNLNNAVFNENDPCACYFYINFDHEKVRIIILDSFTVEGNSSTVRFDSEQLSWLYNTALNVQNEWTVIVFSHQFTNSLTEACNILNAFSHRGNEYGNYLFPDDKITHFVGVVHGHEHYDSFDDTIGFNIIGVTKAYGSNGAVDIFTIDTTAMKMYETRIGNGQSRMFNFT